MKLVLDTLNQAMDKKKDLNGLIFHSDQGFQNTSYEYFKVCTVHGLLVSHTLERRTPLDNYNIKNFHSLLKKEVLYNHDFTSSEKFIHAVSDYITLYNT